MYIYLSIIIIILIIIIYFKSFNNIENFDAIGMYYNIPPAWFIKPEYNMSDWVTDYSRDTIQPTCLPYDLSSKYGSLDNINYISSAYRFWRF